MLTSDLTRLYQHLFHMAEDGSWPSIQRHGLLSTSALVDVWGIHSSNRHELVSALRAESRVVEHPQVGEHLNARTFFFLQRERLVGLLNARADARPQ